MRGIILIAFYCLTAAECIVAEIFYCYVPAAYGYDRPPACNDLSLQWIPAVQLCCGREALSGRNAVDVYERVADADQADGGLKEVRLPRNCKRGFFIANFNRRLCPLWMTNVRQLDICCTGGRPQPDSAQQDEAQPEEYQ